MHVRRFFERTPCRVAIVLTTVVLLASCARGTARDLRISVRHVDTREPMPDATVRVRSLRPFQPTHPHDSVSLLGDHGDTVSATTDGDGHAHLTAPPAPWHLTVTVAGETPRHVDLADVPTATNAWIDLPAEWADAPGVEVSVTEAGS